MTGEWTAVGERIELRTTGITLTVTELPDGAMSIEAEAFGMGWALEEPEITIVDGVAEAAGRPARLALELRSHRLAEAVR
jgi:hypothetical protein